MVASKLTRLDEKTIWEHLKVVRKKKVCGFSGENIEKNNEFFESEVDYTTADVIVWTAGAQDFLIKKTLGWENFGKMFIFLNNCDTKYHRFFSYLIQKKSTTDLILLTLNFMKNSPTADGKLLGCRLMSKLAK